MGSVNVPNRNIDRTVKIYDNFYKFEANVPGAEYDQVYSFLVSVFKNPESAGNFTTVLFRIAQETKTNVLTILQTLEGQDSIQLTVTLAYYLNGLRSPATLLGVNSPAQPNYFVARNILL
jgi:ACT domain-containing protein